MGAPHALWRPWARQATLAAVLSLWGVWGAACGFADAGEGTGTLTVVGELDCAFDTLTTQVTFTVHKGAEPLTNANITLTDGDSHDSLYVPWEAGSGEYRAQWPGYHRRVTAQVWSGADGLMARLEGPGQHTVTHPRSGAVLGLKDALDVRWSTTDGVRAQAVILRVQDAAGGLTHTLEQDGGQHQFAASALAPGRATVTVTRVGQLTPHGGAEGSLLASRYSVTTAIVRQ
jgi:hypothetical protein